MSVECKTRQGADCAVLTERAGLSQKCEIPENGLCPIAVALTGDRSIAQAIAEYKETIA